MLRIESATSMRCDVNIATTELLCVSNDDTNKYIILNLFGGNGHNIENMPLASLMAVL